MYVQFSQMLPNQLLLISILQFAQGAQPMEANSYYSKLVAINQTIVRELKTIQAMPGWQKTSDTPCQLYKMGLGSLMGSKGIAMINYPMNGIFQFIGGIGSMKILDDTVLQEKCVFHENGALVMYYKLRTPVTKGLSDLTMANRGMEQTENKIYFGAKSCDYPYPLEDGVIRANSYISGYILEKITQNQTKVTYVTFVDLKDKVTPTKMLELSQHQGAISGRLEAAMNQYWNN